MKLERTSIFERRVGGVSLSLTPVWPVNNRRLAKIVIFFCVGVFKIIFRGRLDEGVSSFSF